MNRPILTQCLLTASLVVGSIVAAQAQEITAGDLFSGGSRCDHVIHLLQRYGVNNSVNCLSAQSMLHHSPLGTVVIGEAELGDLEIVGVSQIVHEDSACGPKFAVLVRNQSCRNVCNFHVTAVAILGRICPVSPNATVGVEQIVAGETLQVEVTLPIEALAMGNRNGQIIGLQRLVVAIDSFDQLAETNEANNLRAFEIGEIAVLTPAVEAAAPPVSEVQVDSTVAPAPGAAETSPVAPAAPSQPVVEPTADPLRSAIRQMAIDPSSQAAQ